MSALRRSLPWPLLALLACQGPLASASSDEAWLARATVPGDVRPLLVLLDHASGAGGGRVLVAPAYDPTVDYAARVPSGRACDAARVYWRRGPGPAPDCAAGPSVPLDAPATRGLRCDAARGALARGGLFVASRAAQWQDAPGGGGWRELRAGFEDAVECRADRGRHGADPGTWFAAPGGRGPWSADPRDEIDWDAAPLSEAYVLFTGNFLNYLASARRTEEIPVAEAFAAALVAIAGASEGLDVALLRPSPAGAELLLPPTPLPAPERVRDALASPVASPAAGPETSLAALVGWLSADPRAFTHACRAATAAIAGGDAPPGCGDGACLAVSLASLAAGDLAAGLAGAQQARPWALAAAAVDEGIVAAARATGTPLVDIGDPLALPMLAAHALQRDAGPPVAERRSAPAMTGAADARRYEGVSWPEPRRRWPGTAEMLASGGGRLFDAVAALPARESRRILTDLVTSDLTSPDARLEPALAATPREALGLSAHDPVTLDDLAAWLRGSDALDSDADGDRTEPRHALGDPGLEPPQVLRYAGEPGRSLLFVSTADGLVHALDGETGGERWSFLPAAAGAFLRALADPAETRVRAGRAGALRLSRLDLDGDGAIDAAAGERASLLVALGAGARGYVALDVSEPDRPRLAWSIGGDALPGLGETLAPPLAAHMLIDAARQRGDARVAVLTGGYDPLQRLRGAAMDAVAGRLAVVAVASGDILWQAAAAAGPGVSLVEPGLAASFAASPRAVDADGDGLAERLYALDVAGRLWRFDFAGDGAAASLLARLGTADGPGDAAAARRFHAAPDVVYLRDGPAARLALAFGSGWAERPRDAAVDDRFYVVFDTLDRTAPSTPLGEDDLADVTGGEPAPAGAPGWLYRLDAHGAGEKTWGRSVTLGRRLYFATWQPLPPSADAPCGPPRGVARLYTLAIATGLPLEFVDDAPRPSVDLAGEAPPPPLRLALPIRAGEPCADCETGIQLLVGDRAVPTGVGGGPVKTSWRRLESAE